MPSSRAPGPPAVALATPTLLRANVAFRAVAVPAGRHQVELVYRARAVVRGLLVSALALVATLALGLRRRRR